MRGDNWIEFYQTERLTELKEWHDAFCVREDLNYVWLQKACIWILRKIGARATYTEATFNRIGFDADEFVTALFAQHDYIVEEFNYVKPSKLYIGPDEFTELTNSPELRDLYTFRTSYDVSNGQGRYPEVIGLKVTVIPWMKGILVVL